MNGTLRPVKIFFWGGLGFIAVFAIVSEFFLIDEVSWAFHGDAKGEFIFQTVSVFFTLVSVYLAIRLMTFKLFKKRIQKDPAKKEEKYRQLSTCRLSLLLGPVFLNLLFYTLFLNPSFGWLAAMSLLPYLYFYPSERRMERETMNNE
jgi:hypothetical protein